VYEKSTGGGHGFGRQSVWISCTISGIQARSTLSERLGLLITVQYQPRALFHPTRPVSPVGLLTAPHAATLGTMRFPLVIRSLLKICSKSVETGLISPLDGRSCPDSSSSMTHAARRVSESWELTIDRQGVPITPAMQSKTGALLLGASSIAFELASHEQRQKP
jgi:hypothetical protein